MRADRSVYAGLFLVVLSTLLYELLLTRIFSVTTWYHFAFFAISLAMLGMTLGSLAVYLKSNFFSEQATRKHLALSAVLFGVAGIVAVLTHVYCPYLLSGADGATIVLFSLLFPLPFLLITFALSGTCVSLALTRFPTQVGKLYAADLAGAACGCVAMVAILQELDAMTTLFVAAFIAAVAGILFSLGTDGWTKRVCLVAAAVLFSLSAALAYGSSIQKPILRISWTKGLKEVPLLYQKWNSFSCVRVSGDPNALLPPYGYFSETMDPKLRVRQLILDIDGCASTALPYFHGNPTDVNYLKLDVVNMVHYLRPHGDTLVIGTGGGRDLLSSLIMTDNKVCGVEINPSIVHAVNTVFGDFTGHLDRNPRIKIVNDDARSYIAHTRSTYDVILASLVDTWAASASGAYSLTENSLYTKEAWVTFINHLKPDGILAVSRFYDMESPAEFYRLTALAATALKGTGITDPIAHLAIVRDINRKAETSGTKGFEIGTILVSKAPFSRAEVEKLRDLCKQLHFELALAPGCTLDQILTELASGQNYDSIYAKVPWNISPPTDNSPFFFQRFSLRYLFDPRAVFTGHGTSGSITVPLLVLTAVAVLFATIYAVRIPFLRTEDKKMLDGSKPLFVYFFLIGLAFMLIEISQVQRFTIFLGHPTYGVTVVLFSLLLATGLGSLWMSAPWIKRANSLGYRVLLVGILAAFLPLSDYVIKSCADQNTAMRITVTVLALFPVGLVLGIFFPAGMGLAIKKYRPLTPWLWGINGAASVCGSVLSVLISMCVGISWTYVAAVLCYALALFLYAGIQRYIYSSE